MVWCGVVWCGVVWCGVMWCGVMVWCNVVWCDGVLCCVVWCDVVWCVVLWCGPRCMCCFCLLPCTCSSGILLYGPPGTGKTLLAKAVAHEAQANFISISISQLMQSGVGDSEKQIHAVFEQAIKAAPSIVFFDEVRGEILVHGHGYGYDRMKSFFGVLYHAVIHAIPCQVLVLVVMYFSIHC